MSSPLFYIFLLCVVIVTKLGTEIYAVYARKHDIVDKADGVRKIQKNPIPVSGGVVIFSTTALAIIAAVIWCRYSHPNAPIPYTKISVLIGTSLLLVLTGFLDDKRGMKGKKKLLLQILAASILVGYAQNYRSVELFGCTLNLGHLFFPLALFWLVGFVNAINLIDGADGVASTIGIMIFVTSGIIGVLQGKAYLTISFIAFVAAAAVLGFFLCNKPPAKIYLGDSGSMLIGFMAAILLLNVCSVGKGTVRFFPAFCIAFLPILDSFSAIVRRKLAGRSIYFADRSHLHHRIQTHVGRNWTLLMTLFFLQLPLSIGGIWGIIQKSHDSWWSDFIPLGAAFAVLSFLIITNIFGRNELKLMLLSVYRLFCRCVGRKCTKPGTSATSYINLNEDDWKALWDSIIRQTADRPCFYISLDVSIPTMEVDFFASKGEKAEEKGISADPRSIMTLRMPLISDEKRYCGNLILQYNMLNHDSRAAVELAEKLKNEASSAVNRYIGAYRLRGETAGL